jgi:hypothetical protein
MDSLSAQLPRQTLKPVGAAAGDDDVPPGLREPPGGRFPKARSRSGDKSRSGHVTPEIRFFVFFP